MEDLNTGGTACGKGAEGSVSLVTEMGGTDNPGATGVFGGKGEVAENDAVGGFESGGVAPAFETITGGLPISLIGKLGGILISGVNGLGPPGFEVMGSPGIENVTMLGFGDIGSFGTDGLGTFCEDGKGGVIVDPETGGLISSAICRRF